MITSVRGTLIKSLPTQVEVEAGSIGYEILIPMSTYDKLPAPPAEVKLLTHLQVREDAHVLYGFATEEERELFRMLVGQVSGIGPKSALAVLNGMNPLAFRAAVVNNDIVSISKIKGIGKKTAEKIIVELRDKVGVSAAWEQASAANSLGAEAQAVNDAVLALIALGYKQAEAHKAVKGVAQAGGGATPETAILVREALKVL